MVSFMEAINQAHSTSGTMNYSSTSVSAEVSADTISTMLQHLPKLRQSQGPGFGRATRSGCTRFYTYGW
jgi:hypothetical protein